MGRERAALSAPSASLVAPAIVPALLLFCVATALIFLLYPQLAVRDADGFAYIIGARSLHDGHGYRSLIGEPLNHWPPGYSLILSPFQDSILAAKILNYCSFGATIGLLYFLLRRSSWSWQSSLGLTLVLGSGFFRLLANSAHADILTYALFLAGLLAILEFRERRLFPAVIWALLIPVKLIAVVFLPPALAADFFVCRRNAFELLRTYAPGVFVSIAAVLSVLIFDIATTQTWISPSHEEPSLANLVSELRSFVVSIPREFFFSWHGSIAETVPSVAFLSCMVFAAISLFSLRPAPELRWLLAYGVFCLLCCALLLGVRSYIPTVRLVGYGLIVLLLAFRPLKRANSVWLLYGFASLGIGVANALTVDSLGSMDPRYAELAAQVSGYAKSEEPVATNSFYILDLNANVPSVPIKNLGEATNYSQLLWITLPNYDPGSATISPLPHPNSEWCEQKQFTGAILFRRCNPLQR